MDLQFCMELSFLPRRYTEFNPFSSDAYQSYVTATKPTHIIIQELMNLLHGSFPGRIPSLTLSALMSSVLTNCVSVHDIVCISVQVLVEAHAVEQ